MKNIHSWTCGHQAHSCKERDNVNHIRRCKVLEANSQLCRKPHSQLLHGSKVTYCNVTQRRSNSFNGRDFNVKKGESNQCRGPVLGAACLVPTGGEESTSNLCAAPTAEEMMETDKVYVLIPIQRIETLLVARSILCFSDIASNISLVGEKSA